MCLESVHAAKYQLRNNAVPVDFKDQMQMTFLKKINFFKKSIHIFVCQNWFIVPNAAVYFAI